MKTLLTLFSSVLLLTACSNKAEKIALNTPPPPDSYMVCEEMPEIPDLRPLQAFELQDGKVVYLKQEVDSRDYKIARYIVETREAWFSCSTQLQSIKDYYEEAKKQED